MEAAGKVHVLKRDSGIPGILNSVSHGGPVEVDPFTPRKLFSLEKFEKEVRTCNGSVWFTASVCDDFRTLSGNGYK